MTGLYLSPPPMSGLEQQFVQETFASTWIAPLGLEERYPLYGAKHLRDDRFDI